jgi:hypothetical protein
VFRVWLRRGNDGVRKLTSALYAMESHQRHHRTGHDVRRRSDVDRDDRGAAMGSGGESRVGSVVSVRGRLERVGGPPCMAEGGGTPRRGMSGTIYFESEDGAVTTTEAASDGQFTIAVPPGRYAVAVDPGWGGGINGSSRMTVDIPLDGLDGLEVAVHVR